MAGAHPYESKTNDELFELALGGDSEADDDYEAESAWAAIRVLRRRHTADIFERVKHFCASPKMRMRERGLQILTEFGVRDEVRPFFDASVELAIEATRDADPFVVQAAAWALANSPGARSKTALMGLKNHPDPEVRYSVAVGNVGAVQPGAVEVLLELMEDSEGKVRNWATFALGGGDEHDSPEIREAFRKRLADSDQGAKREAIWGLAKRHDRQGLELLLERFEADRWVSGDKQTARDILDLYSGDDPSIEELCADLRALLPS
ncbi:MAG: HEAT repeat domain-containing protein [Bryobacteraceae bacterium]